MINYECEDIQSFEVYYKLIINDVETEINTIVTFLEEIEDMDEVYTKAEKYLNETFNIPLRTLREAHDYGIHSV